MQQPLGRTVLRALTLPPAKEVKTPCGVRRFSSDPGRDPPLAATRVGVYLVAAVAPAARLRTNGDAERGDAMTWTKPTFDEIKMDAEAKSYSGEGENFEE